MHRSILSLVVCIAYIYGGNAFSLSRSGVVTIRTTHANSLQINKRYSTCIASKDDGEDNVEDDIIDREDILDTKKKDKDEPTEATKIYRKIRDITFLPFSYTIQFLGFLVFCGFILNLLGFGYTFDFDEGLRIDRIENLRNELQFEREIVREEREEMKEAAAADATSSKGNDLATKSQWTNVKIPNDGVKELVIPDVPEGL